MKGKALGSLFLFLLLGFIEGDAPAWGGAAGEEEVRATLHRWLMSWEERDIDSYASFYSREFVSKGMDVGEWKSYKKEIFKGNQWLDVEIADLEIEASGEGYTASFSQSYRSSTYSDHGWKRLSFVLEEGSWKIKAEEWAPRPEGKTAVMVEEGEVPASVKLFPKFEPLLAEAPEGGETASGGAAAVREEFPGESFSPRLSYPAGDEGVREPLFSYLPEGREDREESLLGEYRTKPVMIEEIVARVNDKILTMSELRAREAEIIGNLRMNYAGEDFEERARAVKGNIVQDLVTELLLLQRAEDMGVTGQRKEEFIEDLLEEFKRNNQIKNDEELEDLLKDDELDVDTFREMLYRRRLPQYMVYEEVTSKIEITEERIRRFYDSHPEDFTTPEKVRISDIIILTGEERSLEDAAEKARDVYALLMRGGDFPELARRFSDGPTAGEGGKLGFYSHGELRPDLEEVAFSLEVGGVSEPIETEHGFHIIKVEERVEPDLIPLQKVAERIKNRLLENEFDQRLAMYIEEIEKGNRITVNEKYLRENGNSFAPPPPE